MRTPRAGKIQLSVNYIFSLQWIIFLISYTYFGSRVVHFKTKFDRLAQMVQELGWNMHAALAAWGDKHFTRTRLGKVTFFI